MSRRAEPRAGHRDGGFTLVEVIVALGILMTLLVAVLPQLVGGIRATDRARQVTQAKTLVGSELERMRNLPFQVQPNAGQYVDLFDRYFQDLLAPDTAPAGAPTCQDADGRHLPPAVTATGYVDGASRCPWEPQSGPFYRVVRTAAGHAPKGIEPDPDLAGFVVVVDTQFVTASTPPVAAPPKTAYDTKTDGRDALATAQVLVRVTVLLDRPTDRAPISTTTQIARSYQTTTRARAAADATAFTAGTTLADGTAVSASGGLIDLDASLVASSRVEMSAAGLTASAGTGESGGTARTSGTAPPDTVLGFGSTAAGQLTSAGCALVCWGGGQPFGTWQPTTTDGLPGIGSSTSPVEVSLKTPSATEGFALRMGMGSGAVFLPDRGLANPVLRLRSGDFSSGVAPDCTVASTGSGLRLHAGGWARTTAAPGVDACATARTAEVAVLPLGTSPNPFLGASERPLVLVRLLRSSARCQVSGAAHSPTISADFGVQVSYWSGNGTTYVPLTAGDGTTVFTPSNGGQLPDPATLDVGPLKLSTWIDSWSVARPGTGIETTTKAGLARIEIPAVVSILTKPLRQEVVGGVPQTDGAGDPVVDERSTFALSVGSLSCTAEDRR